jgi:hypothetical protein
MGFFYSSRLQTRQPLVPLINRQASITRGLTALANAGPGLKGDLVSGIQAWQFSQTELNAKDGRGIGSATSGTTGVSWDRISNGQPTIGPDSFRFTSPIFTVVAVFNPYVYSSADNIFAAGIGTGTGWNLQSRFSDGTLQAIIWDGSTRAIGSASGKLLLNQLNVVVMTCDGSTMELYNNGVSLGTVAVGGTSLIYDASFTQISLGGAANPFGIVGVGATYYYGAVWNRRLSAKEIKDLADNPWHIYSAPRERIWTPAGGGGTIYTITPSGGIAFSGAASLLRTHVQPVSGSIAFSGSASLRRTHVQVPSGGIVFSGGVSLLRTRAQVPSGQITFSGTAPITFVPATGGTIYTITPSGGFTLSGAVPLLRTRVQIPSGGLSFSGTVPLFRTRVMVPAGNITFTGTVPLVRTRVTVPSGQIVFSGSASIIFIPAGSVTAVTLNRISIGLDRATRVS